MPRGYYLPIVHDGTAVALATEPWIQFAVPATVAIEILSIRIGQGASEASQQECLTFAERDATSATGMTAKTPHKKNPNDPASLVTCHVGKSTSAGNIVAAGPTFYFPWNALAGLPCLFLSEERKILAPGSFWTCQFEVAPLAAKWYGVISFQELY